MKELLFASRISMALVSIALTLPSLAATASHPGSSTSANKIALEAPSSGTGTIEFLAVGRPSLLRIKGKGSSPIGTVSIENQKVSGTFLFDLSTLDTGIDMRTSHMKEKYLETGKYKDAKLTLKDVQLPPAWTPESPNAENIPFVGTLNLHGQEKPVSGTFNTKSAGGGVALEAKFDVKLTDFAIEIPKYAGITVADVVNVSVAVPEMKKTAKE